MGTKVYDNYADLITFNRNSKGTALRPIGYGDELVTNGTFDTDSDWAEGGLWTISGGVATQPAGASPDYLKQSDVLTIGKVYQYSIEVVSGNGSNFPQLYTEAGVVTSFLSGVGTYTGIFVAAGNDVWIRALSPAIDVSVDNVSVKEVLFDREGDPLTLFLHPEGVPRIEYDADRNLKGLLIEPDGQNAMFPSIPDTTWNNTSSVTITTDDSVAPDGTTTATKVEGIGSWIYRNTVIGTDTGTWTFSCWVKAVTVGTNNTFRLTVGGNNLSGNLTATGEWQRFEFTYTDGGGSSNGLLRDSSSNDADLYVWGAQLEESPIATSYIPTTTASVNRLKDDITQTGAQSLIGQTEGTLYLEVDWRSTSGANQILLSVNDGTSSNRMLIYNSSGGTLTMRAQANGITVTEQGESSSAYSGIQKIAFAYKTDDFELYRNGSSISSDTSGSLALLATMTDVDLGQSFTASIPANMHIRAVAIYPTRLSDAECEALTTL